MRLAEWTVGALDNLLGIRSAEQVIADSQPTLALRAYSPGSLLAPLPGEEASALQAWVHCWAQMGPGMAEMHGYPLWEGEVCEALHGHFGTL